MSFKACFTEGGGQSVTKAHVTSYGTEAIATHCVITHRVHGHPAASAHWGRVTAKWQAQTEPQVELPLHMGRT